MSSTIVNWEIAKRLPKPVIPIIYHQLQIKQDELNRALADIVNEHKAANQELRSKFERLYTNIEIDDDNNNNKNKASTTGHAGTAANVVTVFSIGPVQQQKQHTSVDGLPSNSINRREETASAVARKTVSFMLANESAAEGRKHELVHKLKELENGLGELEHENEDSETRLRKIVDSFKSKLDMDENKYSEENLKKLKTKIENFQQFLRDKRVAVQNENKKLLAILVKDNGTIATLNDTLIKKLSLELEERKIKRYLISQDLVRLPHNTVRPLPNINDMSHRMERETFNLTEKCNL